MDIRMKRLVAALIDYVCIFLIALPISYVVIYRDTDISSYYMVITCMVLFAVLFTFRDLVFRNASIGKKIMKIHITNEKRAPIKISTYILRGIPFAFVPIELFLMLKDNRRLGDILSNTWVEENQPDM